MGVSTVGGAPLVLCINGGSSSLKFSAIRFSSSGEDKVFEGAVEKLGSPRGRFWVRQNNGKSSEEFGVFRGSESAIEALLNWIEQTGIPQPGAVGHRFVHGGPRHSSPERVTEALKKSLQDLASFAPLHLPAELLTLEMLEKHLPGTPQVVCFDTAFHRGMPEVARRLPLPKRFFDAGVWRYGFHGLSYEYVVQHLGAATLGRAVLAHLGNGSSMAAVRDGVCIDTSMGFSPTGGFMMGSRSGDLDPGALLHIMRMENCGADEIERIVNREAGLLGVSGMSSSMQELLEVESTNPDAKLAVEMFCYQAAKEVGAFAAALGGLDTLVFTGGIGENAARIRESISSRLHYVGLNVDAGKNKLGGEDISASDSRVSVRVVKTDEDLMIARHVKELLFA